MSPAVFAVWYGHQHVFDVHSPENTAEARSQLALAESEFSAVTELHRAAGTVVVNRHRGLGRMSADYVMQFQDMNTICMFSKRTYLQNQNKI